MKLRCSPRAPKKYGHAHDTNAALEIVRWQTAGARGEHRNFMPQRELSRERRHHDAASTAQRRIFIVAE
jgi:hypothetical protein